MRHKIIWTVVGMVVVLGLLAGGFGCAQPAAPGETTKTVTTTATVTSGAGATTTVTAPAKTVTTTATVTAGEEPEVFNWVMGAQMADSPLLGYYAGEYSDVNYMLHSLSDRAYAEWLGVVTGGRLQITMVEPESVFPTSESVENVGQGVVDMCHVAQGWLTGSMPEANIAMGLPMAWPDPFVAYDCYQNFGFEEIMDELYAERNIWAEYVPTNEIMGFITTFDASSPEKIKGHKIRVWGAYGKLVEAMGGLPVAMAYGDVYMGLKLGTVEGSATGALALENCKLKEVAMGMTTSPRTNNPVNAILINMDSFNALPDDIKVIIDEGTQRYQIAVGASEGMQNRLGLATAKKDYGVQEWKWSGEDELALRKLAQEEVWPYYGGLSTKSQELLDLMIAHMQAIGLL